MAIAMMSEREARRVQDGLWCTADFSRFRLPKGVLSALLIQKGITLSKRNFERTKARERHLLGKWNRGENFVKIAQEENMLPLSIAFLLREHLGLNRKSFQRMLVSCNLPHNPKKDDNAKMRRVLYELEEACRCDYLHSPLALDYMRFKGRFGEELAARVLAGRGIEFRSENEQDRKTKTPDFLFKKKEMLFGVEAHWLESKATFCNYAEAMGDWRTQLSHYLKLFGPGIVVYWFGFTVEALSKLTGSGIKAVDGREIGGLFGREMEEQVEAMLNSGIELEPRHKHD